MSYELGLGGVAESRRHGDAGTAGVVVFLAGAAGPLEVVADQRVAVPLDQVAGVCGRRAGKAGPAGGTAERADSPTLTSGPSPSLRTYSSNLSR